MSVCLQFPSNGTVQERFLAFVPLTHLNSPALKSTIVNFVTRIIGLQMKKCIAQAYHGT
jgi:hypothetical protein